MSKLHEIILRELGNITPILHVDVDKFADALIKAVKEEIAVNIRKSFPEDESIKIACNKEIDYAFKSLKEEE